MAASTGALVSKSIPNLINGVSQQPAALRLATQCELQENAYDSEVEGLKRRPPTQHVAKIHTGTLAECFMHVINRDASERYIVTIIDDDLKVHDINGTAKTVNFPNGKGYLNAATPKTSFRCCTIADYTFIVNREITTAMSASTTADRGDEGLVFVKIGAAGSEYKVFVDGVEKASYTTLSVDTAGGPYIVDSIRTNNIATELKNDLVTNLGAGWTVTLSQTGSCIHVKKDNGSAFKLSTLDSHGGTALVAIKNTIAKVSELPTVAPTDFHLEVIGDESSSYDNYYVKFVPNDSGATFADGTWQETLAQGIKYKFDNTTMPHTLVRNGDGTFTFDRVTWDERLCGDATSAPEPSFIGRKLNDVFFAKNRLGLLADDNNIMSEVGHYFNFFPTTVTTTVDSDPIDEAASNTEVSILYHAQVFNKVLVAFSDQAQFVTDIAQPLTSKTFSMDKVTKFETDINTKPVASGKVLFFAIHRGNFDGVRELYVDNVTAVYDAGDVTEHVPAYIPKGIFKLAAATNESVMLAGTTGDPSALYVYKYFYMKGQKVQSAWGRWTFGDAANTKVLSFEFIETTLYLMIQRSDGVYLEKMFVQPGLVDDNATYVTHLDRRITNSQCTSVVYDSGTNQTTFTLPYPIDGTMAIVTRATDPAGALSPGRAITIASQGSNTLVVAGDHSTTAVWIGQKLRRRYRFSTIYMREQSKGGGENVITEGRLQLRNLKLIYDTTGYFEVTITTDFRDPATYVFTGRIIGEGHNIINKVALLNGEFTVPVWSKNDRVTIDIDDDHFLPSRFAGAEWEGFYTNRNARV